MVSPIAAKVNRLNPMKRSIPDKTHPPSLSDFIIAAIEEAAPALNGSEIYMRGFQRFTDYCANRHREANAAQIGKYPPPPPQRTIGKRIVRPRG